MDILEADIVIVGGGVVGLAIATYLSQHRPKDSILLLERHKKFGFEASSHNSEVIHAGIYYSPGSLKARSCIRGKNLLYEFADAHSVPYRKLGKYIVASAPSQLSELKKISDNSAANGVPLEYIDGHEVTKRVPIPSLRGALWSKTSGIIDSHQLMYRLLIIAEQRGTSILFNNEVQRVLEYNSSSIILEVKDGSGSGIKLKTKMLVNSGGLYAAKMAMAFQPDKKYEHRACRGRYFSLTAHWRNRFDSLIYPLPDPTGGLGVHLTLDLEGNSRLGPDVDWSRSMTGNPESMSHYEFDPNWEPIRQSFFASGKHFLPNLQLDDLRPDYVGVRPKLFINGEAYPDFLISDLDIKAPQIHLLGIESPGLTSCLALAQDVSNIVKSRLN